MSKDINDKLGYFMGWTKVWLVAYSNSHYIGGHYDDYKQCKSDCGRDTHPIPFWQKGGSITVPVDEWNPTISYDSAFKLHNHIFSNYNELFQDVYIDRICAIIRKDHIKRWPCTIRVLDILRYLCPMVICKALDAAIEVTGGGSDCVR